MHAFAYGANDGFVCNLYQEPAAPRMLAAAFRVDGVALEFIQGWTGIALSTSRHGGERSRRGRGWVLAPPRLPNFLHGCRKLLRV